MREHDWCECSHCLEMAEAARNIGNVDEIKEARKDAFLEAAELVKRIDFAMFPDNSSRTSIKLYIFELLREKAEE